MTVINTNMGALLAQSSISKNQVNLSQAMQRLSTGSRVNSSADDASGLAMGTLMTSQINAFSQGIRNANDGLSLTQTANGHLTAISDSLQRIRQLAVQAANGALNTTDRSLIQSESTQLVQEIQRIAVDSSFNNVNLLDGSFASQSVQVGANNTAADKISFSINSAQTSALGVGAAATSASVTGGATGDGTGHTALAAGYLSINGISIGASASDGVSTTDADSSALAIANAINAAQTTVQAHANATTKTYAVTGSAGVTIASDLAINGQAIGALSAATGSSSLRASQLASAINAVSAASGVTATSTGSNLYLTAADGRNIDLQADFNGATAIGASVTGNSGTTLVDNISYSTVSLSSNASTGIIIAGGGGGLTAGTTVAAVNTTSLATIDLSSTTGAQNALAVIDKSIDQINNTSAVLGAYQTRFQEAITDLQTSSDNLSASRSRIMDTDYAAESTNLAKSQIIAQAATAMLAQANQLPQQVLALLK
jgi:flagellin